MARSMAIEKIDNQAGIPSAPPPPPPEEPPELLEDEELELELELDDEDELLDDEELDELELLLEELEELDDELELTLRLIVRASVTGALAPTELVAVSTMLAEPLVVGVPEMSPVGAFTLRPAGRFVAA